MNTPKCSQQAGCVLCYDPRLPAVALAARCALPQPRLGAASPTILVLQSKAPATCWRQSCVVALCSS